MADHSTVVRVSSPSYQAYHILHVAFTIAPIVAGIDKFTMLLVDWTKYLADPVARAIPAHTFMMVVGGIEIIAGLLVAFRPSVGGYVVAFWLWGIIANLLLVPGFYDVALRDFGLFAAALTLGRLASKYDPPGLRVHV